MSASERTEVLTDQKEIMQRLIGIFSNAKSGVDILAETITSPESYQAQDTGRTADAYFDVLKRGGRLRILTKMDGGNVENVKELMKTVELRHLDDVRGNFAVSESEYMSSQGSSVFLPDIVMPVIYSNSRSLVGQNARVFETLWGVAESAEGRIREIEAGFDRARTETIRDANRIRRLYLDLVRQAKEEILLILPTANAFRRQQKVGAIDAAQAAAERGVKVNIMTPNSLVHETLQELSARVEAKVGRRLMNHRTIPEADAPVSVTVLVVDRNASLVIEQKDDSPPDFEKAALVATYSTRNSTVLANIRFFERMWQEVELILRAEHANAKERRSRRTAELLQDILSHDIRNYNQVSMTSAELLAANLEENAEVLNRAVALVDTIVKGRGSDRSDEGRMKTLREYLIRSAKSSADADRLVESITKAVEGSSSLIDKAKKLGSIVSQDEIRLHPVDLESSIRRSVDLVVAANARRSIDSSFSTMPSAKVLADEMLDEVFINLLSNSVNYTEKDEVPVEIKVEAGALESKPGKYWKMTFTDHGKGIPDEMKGRIFERYHRTASGKGLGLSIVYALAVERYSGELKITDRVKGDPSKGTRIELWLRSAP